MQTFLTMLLKYPLSRDTHIIEMITSISLYQTAKRQSLRKTKWSIRFLAEWKVRCDLTMAKIDFVAIFTIDCVIDNKRGINHLFHRMQLFFSHYSSIFPNICLFNHTVIIAQRNTCLDSQSWIIFSVLICNSKKGTNSKLAPNNLTSYNNLVKMKVIFRHAESKSGHWFPFLRFGSFFVGTHKNFGWVLKHSKLLVKTKQSISQNGALVANNGKCMNSGVFWKKNGQWFCDRNRLETIY